MSYNKFKKLRKGTYKVLIDSSFRKGSMTYADFLIKGKVKKRYFLQLIPVIPQWEIMRPLELVYFLTWVSI